MPGSPSDGYLFDTGASSWTAPPLDALPPERTAERTALLLRLASGTIARVEDRVARILQRFPETRDSDTALAVRYWSINQADILADWDHLQLDVLFNLEHFETLSRCRRHIQNDLHLFIGSPETRARRGLLQREFHEYIAAQRVGDPEIRFYLDEGRAGANSRFRGIGGICSLEWRGYEKFHLALQKWRAETGWTETLHFADIRSDDSLDKYLALLAQLRKRRGGLLFVGYALPIRSTAEAGMVDLFIQTVTETLGVAELASCLQQPRGLVLIKEAEDGWDHLYLDALRSQLTDHLLRVFGQRVYLKDVMAIPKGREVLLECADLIVGGMQRRAMYSGYVGKDKLAEAVMNVTGFEDPGDGGMMFKSFL